MDYTLLLTQAEQKKKTYKRACILIGIGVLFYIAVGIIAIYIQIGCIDIETDLKCFHAFVGEYVALIIFCIVGSIFCFMPRIIDYIDR